MSNNFCFSNFRMCSSDNVAKCTALSYIKHESLMLSIKLSNSWARSIIHDQCTFLSVLSQSDMLGVYNKRINIRGVVYRCRALQ